MSNFKAETAGASRSHIIFNGQGGPIAGATAVIDATGGYTRSVVSMGLHKKGYR